MTPDFDRLARAIHLDAEPTEHGDAWLVTGGSGSHIVSNGTCDCIDFGVRGTPCKHLLAVALRRGDRDVIEVLRLMVPLPRARGRSSSTAQPGQARIFGRLKRG